MLVCLLGRPTMTGNNDGRESKASSHGEVEGGEQKRIDAEDMSYEQVQAEIRKERKLLNQIELALRKIAEEEYGFCEGTGEPISKKRLALRPWTRYSIEYKEELERRKKQGLR